MKWPGGVLLVCFPNKMRSLFLKCVFVSCSWRDGHLMCVLIPEVQQDRGTSVPTASPASHARLRRVDSTPFPWPEVSQCFAYWVRTIISRGARTPKDRLVLGSTTGDPVDTCASGFCAKALERPEG